MIKKVSISKNKNNFNVFLKFKFHILQFLVLFIAQMLAFLSALKMHIKTLYILYI